MNDTEGIVEFPQIFSSQTIHCNWSIVAPSGYKIALEIETFKPLWKSYSQCYLANLTFWDRHLDGGYPVYCEPQSDRRPKRIISLSRTLNFTYFRTRYRYGGQGFRIKYYTFGMKQFTVLLD